MRVAVLGCGVMGSAFARQLALQGHQVILCDRNREKGEALVKELECSHVQDPKEAAAQAEFILLAIKPKDLKGLDLGKLDGHIILSILAGTEVNELKKAFKGAFVVRSMPNLALTCADAFRGCCPCQSREGASRGCEMANLRTGWNDDCRDESSRREWGARRDHADDSGDF